LGHSVTFPNRAPVVQTVPMREGSGVTARFAIISWARATANQVERLEQTFCRAANGPRPQTVEKASGAEGNDLDSF